jgi:two-component system, NarL family, nitrate/nitrite response regulator NarL
MQSFGQAATDAVNVALVAAYPSVRAGLRALLNEDGRISVVAEAASLRDLVSESTDAIAVAVIDLDLDGVWGTPADVGRLSPEVGVVMLGPHPDESGIVDVLGERPWAYLLKDAGASELARAVEAVASGLVVVQPPLAQRLFAPAAQGRAPGAFAGLETEGEALTAREHEVLQLVAEGLPNKLIAIRLGISEHTVKFHITSILSKLDASSRTEAVRLGAHRGLVIL